eukprot:CAMPEP_0184661080 /NCGR_PEP_ID=MMETSP0308-20130426/36890_1 /TAXON_ID=38269 /ORGANISM="Gloeochaete witrockiana, Strain SAG 46.84" /LENGTH=642 /DNA_ID=CAMNT_0027102151 /DNA_START=363 /DNA_END=2291 /DNA_ORIENTATION=+
MLTGPGRWGFVTLFPFLQGYSYCLQAITSKAFDKGSRGKWLRFHAFGLANGWLWWRLLTARQMELGVVALGGVLFSASALLELLTHAVWTETRQEHPMGPKMHALCGSSVLISSWAVVGQFLPVCASLGVQLAFGYDLLGFQACHFFPRDSLRWPRLSCLKILDLSYSYLKSCQLKFALRAIDPLHLEEINLSGLVLKQACSKELVNLISKAQRLRVLRLADCSISPPQILADVLDVVGMELHELDLSRTPWSRSFAESLERLFKRRSLALRPPLVLHLKCNMFGLFQAYPELHQRDILVVRALATGGLAELHVLDLPRTILTPIQSLDISWRREMIPVFDHSAQTLTKLSLPYLPVLAEELHALCTISHLSYLAIDVQRNLPMPIAFGTFLANIGAAMNNLSVLRVSCLNTDLNAIMLQGGEQPDAKLLLGGIIRLLTTSTSLQEFKFPYLPSANLDDAEKVLIVQCLSKIRTVQFQYVAPVMCRLILASLSDILSSPDKTFIMSESTLSSLPRGNDNLQCLLGHSLRAVFLPYGLDDKLSHCMHLAVQLPQGNSSYPPRKSSEQIMQLLINSEGNEGYPRRSFFEALLSPMLLNSGMMEDTEPHSTPQHLLIGWFSDAFLAELGSNVKSVAFDDLQQFRT